MKSVVMIAHFFPPEGSAGVYRPLRFVRHLPVHGWRPLVVTAAPGSYERYDPELLNLIPAETEIVRIANPDPWKAFQNRRIEQSRKASAAVSGANSVAAPNRADASRHNIVRSTLRRAIHKLEGMVYHPDLEMSWIRPASKATAAACVRSQAKVIWATGGPWSSFVAARNASLQTGTPYVLDFRDSWTLAYNEFQRRQPAWAIARNQKLLSRLFADARAVVFRYMSEAEAYWRAYPGALDAERIHLIPNGYEGAIAPFTAPKGDRCTVLYTGGVGPYWYDGLLEGLRLLRNDDPEGASRLKVIFVGEGTPLLGRQAAELGLTGIVETEGVLTYSEVNRLQQEAHALLLLGWKAARGHELGGSKIFGYMKSGRPVIGVLPKDENARILRSIGVRLIAYAGSPVEIRDAFQELLKAWSNGELAALLPDPKACEPYSAEFQTRALTRALDGEPAETPFQPGRCAPPASLQDLIGPAGWVKAPRRVLSIDRNALTARLPRGENSET